MASKKSFTPLLGRLFEALAPRIGAVVVLEPEWGVAGQITFKNGRRRYFRFSSIDLNPLGSSEIAKDKDFSNYFMRQLGYPVIEGGAFFSPQWSAAINSSRDTNAAWEYASALGFPVIVKPNSQSQGRGVSLVRNRDEFISAINYVFEQDRVALVQKYISGNDYRIVVLDGRVISAYQRIPLRVTGDGVSSIRELIDIKQEYFINTGRDTKLKPDDPRILNTLINQGFEFSSIPDVGETIPLLVNANLSSGGESIDVTSIIHPFFQDVSARLTRDMGLRLCGVDMMIEGDISNGDCKFWIIEINAAPGLDHYASSGESQKKIVEELYLEVLKSMEE